MRSLEEPDIYLRFDFKIILSLIFFFVYKRAFLYNNVVLHLPSGLQVRISPIKNLLKHSLPSLIIIKYYPEGERKGGRKRLDLYLG